MFDGFCGEEERKCRRDSRHIGYSTVSQGIGTERGSDTVYQKTNKLQAAVPVSKQWTKDEELCK